MVKILDHGYMLPVDSYGSDQSIIEAARMSTNKGFLGWGPVCGNCGKLKENQSALCSEGCGRITKDGDEKLLRYLYEHNHSTPFEMAGLIIEVQAPIFVFREWHRHRTQSYNEMSARYTPLPDLNYIPTVERLMLNSKTNKQAGTVAGARELTVEDACAYRGMLELQYEADENLYQAALQMGVPKELARIHLPVGRYSRMRAHANLRNWMAFMTLRMDKAAQWEIRQYASAVHDILVRRFPRSMKLFDGE